MARRAAPAIRGFAALAVLLFGGRALAQPAGGEPTTLPPPGPSDGPPANANIKSKPPAKVDAAKADAAKADATKVDAAKADATKPGPKQDPAKVLPPRPPTLPYEPPEPLPWERHIEVGPDLAFVTQPAAHDEKGKSTGVHYNSTFGFAAHATWQMLRYLQFSVYFVDSNHGMKFDPDRALGLPGQISSDSAHTYSFGARFQPMIPFREDLRAWLSGGIGWARWDYPRMEVDTGSGSCKANTYVVDHCYMLYERADNMAVFPIGIGASWDFWPHRLALVVEFSALLPAFQSGTGVSSTRAVNDRGANVPVGGLPLVDVMLVETLGVSAVF